MGCSVRDLKRRAPGGEAKRVHAGKPAMRSEMVAGRTGTASAGLPRRRHGEREARWWWRVASPAGWAARPASPALSPIPPS